MYFLLLAMNFVIFFLNGIQQYELWTDSSFSLEELEEEDPGNGVRMLCEQVLQDCDLKNLDNYHCRLRYHLDYPRGGWFMDVHIKEKITYKDICVFELNRQTQEIRELKLIR